MHPLWMGKGPTPTTLTGAIAPGLNERGMPTARGTGPWSATQVMRVLAGAHPTSCAEPLIGRVFREIPTSDEARRIAINVS